MALRERTYCRYCGAEIRRRTYWVFGRSICRRCVNWWVVVILISTVVVVGMTVMGIQMVGQK